MFLIISEDEFTVREVSVTKAEIIEKMAAGRALARIHHLTEIYLFVEDFLIVSASTWCIGPGKLSETTFPSAEKTLKKPLQGAPAHSYADKVSVSAVYLL